MKRYMHFEILFKLEKYLRIIKRTILESDLDLTFAEFTIILEILNGNNTNSAICENLYLDKSYVSRILKRLYRNGIVSSTENTGSKKTEFLLTVIAIDILEELYLLGKEISKNELRDFKENEKKLIKNYLTKLLDTAHPLAKNKSPLVRNIKS